MNQILTPIVNKNGQPTRVWKKPPTDVTQSRLAKMMNGVPAQTVSFSKFDAENANADTVSRYFDEALVKDRMDDFGKSFASNPHLPALYQRVLLFNDRTAAVADALIENPNVSVSTVEMLYEASTSEHSFLASSVHPLLPIDKAKAEYESGYLAQMRDTSPEWFTRAQAQIDRVKSHVEKRQESDWR